MGFLTFNKVLSLKDHHFTYLIVSKKWVKLHSRDNINDFDPKERKGVRSMGYLILLTTETIVYVGLMFGRVVR